MRFVRLGAALAATLLFSILTAAQTAPGSTRRAPQSHGFSIVEAGIDDMQRAMREGRVTSRELVRQYLERIGTYDVVVHATLAVNSHALEDAARLDRERAGGHVRGPLHGRERGTSAHRGAETLQ